MSQLDVVRSIYGSKLANELLDFSLDKGAGLTTMNLCHKVRGLISNANYKYIMRFSLHIVHSQPNH